MQKNDALHNTCNYFKKCNALQCISIINLHYPMPVYKNDISFKLNIFEKERLPEI